MRREGCGYSSVNGEMVVLRAVDASCDLVVMCEQRSAYSVRSLMDLLVPVLAANV